MVRANQSGHINKSQSLCAGTAPEHEMDGTVVLTLPDRENGDRAGTRPDERKSKRAEGVGKLTFIAIGALRADPRNPRKHSRIQVRAIARSIDAFGFNAPILVDKRNQIVAGHGRFEAAQLLGLENIPVISLDHLTEAQARAYLLADNKLAERSSWDDASLALQLKELSELALDFDFEAIGFELPEVDLRIQSLDPTDNADKADEFRNALGPAVSLPRDLWLLGKHRVYCGSALDPLAYELLMAKEKASAVFTEPPYNVKIDGNVCGSGAVKHREFAMASGEMTREEFARFLAGAFDLARAHASPGAIIYACMDWRHVADHPRWMFPFHADLGLVAQRRGGLLFRHHTPPNSTRSFPFCRRFADRDHTLHRLPQQRFSTVRMDHFRQSNLRKTRQDPCTFSLSQCTSEVNLAEPVAMIGCRRLQSAKAQPSRF
jgi:hypothetical protein